MWIWDKEFGCRTVKKSRSNVRLRELYCECKSITLFGVISTTKRTRSDQVLSQRPGPRARSGESNGLHASIGASAGEGPDDERGRGEEGGVIVGVRSKTGKTVNLLTRFDGKWRKWWELRDGGGEEVGWVWVWRGANEPVVVMSGPAELERGSLKT